MDPLGFGRIVADKWDILMMSPAAFGAALGLGFILGLAVTRIFLNERLTHQQIRIADLQAVLDGKLPANLLPTERSKRMSLGLILIFVGIAIAFIGALVMLSDRSSPPTARASTIQHAEEQWMLPREALRQFAKDVNEFELPAYAQQQLLQGNWVARGTPHVGSADENKPVIIGRAQWQTLRLAGQNFSSAASTVGPSQSYDNLEISRNSGPSKSQPATVNPTKSNPLLPDDGGPITWDAGYLLGAGGDDKGMRISTLQMTGQNNSDEFIEPLSGFIRSEVTGVELPILVNDNGTLLAPDGYGIPARHQFMIGSKLSDAGISGGEFLRDFGRMTFTFKYGNHTYTKHFTREELEAEVRRTEIDLRPKPIQGVAGVRRKSQ